MCVLDKLKQKWMTSFSLEQSSWQCSMQQYINKTNSVVTFSKSGKRTVSDGFVKKSADSDSVSDSRRIINLHTPAAVEHSICPLVGANAAGDDAPRMRSFLAGKTQRNHRPTCHVPDTPRTHARTWTSDAAMQAASRRRTTLHNAKTTCHPP